MSGVVTLILAAGRGRRLGAPKALLELDGVPLAVAHARARLAAESERVVLVVLADVADAIATDDARVRVVVSSEPDADGPAGSIRAALRASALDGARVVVVTPVDIVPARAASVAMLLEPLGSATRAARFEHGHPIACAPSVVAEAYAVGAPPLRSVLAALGRACAIVPLPKDDPHLTHDLDTPADVVALTGAAPRFARRDEARYGAP